MGLDESAAYLVPRYQINAPEKVASIVWYTVASTTAVGFLVGVLIYGQAGRLATGIFSDPTLRRDIAYSLFLVPTMMLVTVTAGVLRGLGRSDLRSVVYYYIVGPGFLLAIAYLSLHDLTLRQTEVVRIVSYAVAGLLAVLLIARVLSQQPGDRFVHPEAADIGSLHRLGGSLILVRLSQYVIEQPTIDVLVVGHFATAAAAGVYYAAAKVGLIVSLGLATLTIVVAPVLSGTVARKDAAALLEAYSWATTWMSILGVLIGGAVIVLRHEILALFGHRYVAGQSILVIFALGQILAALLGPNTPLLIATGRVKVEIILTAVFAVTMIVSQVLLGALFGAFGVACASAGSFLLLAILRYKICGQRYELPPIGANLRVLLVGVVATGAGAIAHRWILLGPIAVAAISATVFCVVFATAGFLAVPAIPVALSRRAASREARS
jgi:O-antigen/teichoic acid export membrane protein